MSVLASAVMDDSRAYLNDSAIDLYSNTVLLPYLKIANRELSDKCMVYGIANVRAVGTVITVTAGTTLLTLPTDFFIPVRLFERGVGQDNNSWIPMFERMWEPENVVPTTTLNYWAFRNDAVYLIGSSADREVKLEYERSLIAVAGASDPIDSAKFQRFLAAVTAEKAARFVGENAVRADSIKNEESIPAGLDLAQFLVGNQQGVRQRRRPFTTRTRYGVN